MVVEGLIWEALQVASEFLHCQLYLYNRKNNGQNDGATSSISPYHSLKVFSSSLWFDVLEINGHDYKVWNHFQKKSKSRSDNYCKYKLKVGNTFSKKIIFHLIT